MIFGHVAAMMLELGPRKRGEARSISIMDGGEAFPPDADAAPRSNASKRKWQAPSPKRLLPVCRTGSHAGDIPG
jgi:hypothetical protein